MKYINSAATAIGIILTKYITQKAGVQNVNAKHHVLKYVTNINLDKRMTQEEYIKSYPTVPYTESIDADKLAEGRIYIAETMNAESRLSRSFLCVKQVYPKGFGISLYFGVYFEMCGTLVHIMDSQAKNYQSVASSQYANFIYKNIGIRRIDDYQFFIPSRGQVMNALDIIGSLGYEFVDGEIRKK